MYKCLVVLQILDDGGDATDRMLLKFPSVFNQLKGIVEREL